MCGESVSPVHNKVSNIKSLQDISFQAHKEQILIHTCFSSHSNPKEPHAQRHSTLKSPHLIFLWFSLLKPLKKLKNEALYSTQTQEKSCLNLSGSFHDLQLVHSIVLNLYLKITPQFSSFMPWKNANQTSKLLIHNAPRFLQIAPFFY